MKMLTPAEVAERLSISYDTALRMIKYGNLPHMKIGRQYRVSEKVITEMMEQADVVTIEFDETV